MSLTCFAPEEYRRLVAGAMPHSAVVLYLWLRSRMTWKTRIVGDHRAGISWQAICEALAIEWRAGWVTAPSHSAARRAAAHLVRAGLVVMRSNSTERQLIFECVLAPQNSSVQKMADRPKTRHPDRPVQREKPGHPDRPKNGHPDRHLDFVSTGVHLDTRATNSAVDNELFFPPMNSSKVNRALGALIRKSNANGSAQLMLDELAAFDDRKGVYSKGPVDYLRSLIEKEQRGDFWPSNGALNIGRRRKETHRNIAAPHKARDRTAGREALAQLRAMLPKGLH